MPFYNGVYYDSKDKINTLKLETIRLSLDDTKILREFLIYLNSDMVGDVLDSIIDFYGIEEE